MVDSQLMAYLMMESVNALSYSSQIYNDRVHAAELEIQQEFGTELPPVQKSAEDVSLRLEHMGYIQGAAICERLTQERELFPTTSRVGPDSDKTKRGIDILEAMKFLCRDVWAALYEHQVDNLRTNHKGIFVIQDNRFVHLRGVSGLVPQEMEEKRSLLLAMHRGIIRGVLAALGIEVSVAVEIESIDQCSFHVKVVRYL